MFVSVTPLESLRAQAREEKKRTRLIMTPDASLTNHEKVKERVSQRLPASLATQSQTGFGDPDPSARGENAMAKGT